MNIVDAFDQSFPRAAQAKLLRAVFQGCMRAHDDAKQFGPGRTKDSVPNLRRLHVEKFLEQALLGPGFAVTRHQAPSSTNLRVESMGAILTMVTRNRTVHRVKPAEYRAILATQLDLFRSAAVATGQLFGLLVYGGGLREYLPGQARIVFPDERGIFDAAQINLFARFPDVVEHFRSGAGRPAEVAAVPLLVPRREAPLTKVDESAGLGDDAPRRGADEGRAPEADVIPLLKPRMIPKEIEED